MEIISSFLYQFLKILEETKDWTMKKACTECIQLLLELYINNDMETLLTTLKVKKGKKEISKSPAENSESKDKFKIILNLLTDHLNERN